MKKLPFIILILLITSVAYGEAINRYTFDENEPASYTYTDSVGSDDGTASDFTGNTHISGYCCGAFSTLGGNHSVTITEGHDIFTGLEEFSISLWINRSSGDVNADGSYLADKRGESQGNFLLKRFVASGNPRLLFACGPAAYNYYYVANCDSFLSVDSWHHIVVVYDSIDYGLTSDYFTNSGIWIDGVKRTSNGSIFDSVEASNSNDLVIGRINSVYTSDAGIDEIRFYNHALTQGEIDDLYAMDCPPCDPPEPNEACGDVNCYYIDVNYTLGGSATGSKWATAGSTNNIIATAATGYTFTGWSGPDAAYVEDDEANDTNFLMPASPAKHYYYVTADFEWEEPAPTLRGLTIGINGCGTLEGLNGYVIVGGNYFWDEEKVGYQRELIATPCCGIMSFANYTGDINGIDDPNSAYTINTMQDYDTNIYANFELTSADGNYYARLRDDTYLSLPAGSLEDIIDRQFSLSFWLDPTEGHPTGTKEIMSAIHSSGPGSYEFKVSQTTAGTIGLKYYKFVNNSGLNFESDVLWSAGACTWKHIVIIVCQEGSNVNGRIFADGTLIGEDTQVGTMEGYTTESFYIGRGYEAPPTSWQNFDGKIDDIRFYDTNMTSEKMAEINGGGYGTEVNTADPNLKWYFDCNIFDTTSAAYFSCADGSCEPNCLTNEGVDFLPGGVMFSATAHTITYTAGTGGTITGDTIQTVEDGEDGTPVMAVPDAYYHFAGWSDANESAIRRETNVTEDLSFTANFGETLIIEEFKRNFGRQL